MILPATIAGFVGPNSPLAAIGQWFNPLSLPYNLVYAVIIVFFLAQKAFIEGVTLTGVKG